MRMRKNSLSVLLAMTTGAMFAGVVAAQQASAADLILGSGAYTANTTALTLTGPSVNVHGTNVGGVAVFKFHTITVPSSATITAKGSRPFELQASGALVVRGTIDASGTDAAQESVGPFAGGAGGGAGGAGFPHSGVGPGAGKAASNTANGGGGAGFGGNGAYGGLDTSGTVGARGAAYGNLNVRLQGGSGGGGASNVGGGGGGGAIGLFGDSVTIGSDASVLAEGGAGSGGGNGGSGGGSGGAILVHGNSVQLSGVLDVAGGNGGGGGCCGDGGGGGGGRIAIQYRNFVSRISLDTVETGGGSGLAGTFGHGGLSPNATGATGLLTIAQIDGSHLTIGGNRSITKGHSTTVSTRLSDTGTGASLPGRAVTLWRKPASGGSWTKVATKTTSASGTASRVVAPGASTIYQWRFAGTFIHLATRSANEKITVHA